MAIRWLDGARQDLRQAGFQSALATRFAPAPTLAALVPARRAAAVDPLVALRCE